MKERIKKWISQEWKNNEYWARQTMSFDVPFWFLRWDTQPVTEIGIHLLLIGRPVSKSESNLWKSNASRVVVELSRRISINPGIWKAKQRSWRWGLPRQFPLSQALSQRGSFSFSYISLSLFLGFRVYIYCNLSQVISFLFILRFNSFFLFLLKNEIPLLLSDCLVQICVDVQCFPL